MHATTPFDVSSTNPSPIFFPQDRPFLVRHLLYLREFARHLTSFRCFRGLHSTMTLFRSRITHPWKKRPRCLW
jgi:hypothetical protein